MKTHYLRNIALWAFATLMSGIGSTSAGAAQAIPISDQPLFTQSGQVPLMMMVMSRDEQLFVKAYDDYSDLDNDGKLDVSYVDTFDYSGYFDPHFCYTYSSGLFTTDSAASGTNNHTCSGKYSGNFMNWVSMSRLDVLNFVMFGGRRSAQPDAGGATLERAPIPADLHAWVKVYNGSDINNYTPFSYDSNDAGYSFCNATMGAYSAPSTNTLVTPTVTPPSIRVSKGAHLQWSSTALQQCQWREDAYPTSNSQNGQCSGSSGTASGNNSCWDDASTREIPGGLDKNGLTARIRVCSDSSKLESFCESYTNSAGTTVYRPAGLLQQYGESGSMRFGLLTGSFSAPRSGGVLRRNIGVFAGNTGATDAEGCAADDEINLQNGKFCTHSSSGNKGILATMSSLLIDNKYNYGGTNWNDCNTYSILNRQGFSSQSLNNPGTGSQNCSAWGNPLSEMYAEALRYITTPNPTSSSPTSGFNASGDLAGLPTGVTWKDPYRSISNGGNPYCANCSILVMSTGLNSFDSDEIPAVSALPRSAAAATTAVGTAEGVTGTYSIGRNATGTPGDLAVGNSVATHTDLCTAKTVSDLSRVRGICPDVPATEGSYLMDGLAYDAWINDTRPDLVSSPPAGNPVKPSTFKNTVKTFAVSLAHNLPSFQIPVGSGTISLAPLCQSNNTGNADALGALGSANDTNWRSCFLGGVTIGKVPSTLTANYTYGRDLDVSTTPQFGSFTFVWEDSLWGNDHDNDVVTIMTYCVGASCTTGAGAKTGTRTNLDGTAYNGADICWRAYGVTGTTSAKAGGFSAPGLANATRDPYGDTSPCPANGNPTVAADEVLIRLENVSAYAGNAMLTGYNISGSDNDGIKRLELRPGSTDNSIITQSLNPPTSWYAPIVLKYKSSTPGANQLQNPLFYAAKYGSFNDLNHNNVPDPGEWDTKQAGTPDNFFAVTDPGKLKQQLQQVFSQVLKDASPTASVATSTPRFVPGGTLAYQVSYKASDWTGDIQAFNLNSDGTLGSFVWSANAKLPAASARNIVSSKIDTSTVPAKFVGTDFSTSGLTSAEKTALLGTLNTAVYNISDLINYLRGDQSKEQSAAGPYRNRSSKIGDILNSSPAVQTQSTFAYARLPLKVNGVSTGSDTYAAYVAGKSTAPVVYVGANDGMLHAVAGDVNSPGGKELFAYVPNAILPDLGQLALPSYSHHYYVDGTPLVGDAHLGGAWKTMVVSSTGAFGTTGNHHGAVFALDVSGNPSSFGASNVMWEFNDQLDSTDMGQALVQPSLGLTQDGNWVVAFGNGYNSARNHAVLYIRDAATGASVAKLDTGVGSSASPNGLSSAIIVDTDGDGGAETIYAGDYQGNVWKFSYNTSTSTWAVAFSGSPLFTAVDSYGHAQPITSGMYTIANPIGGTMVIFGTGKYLAVGDNNPLQLQSDGKPLVNSIYAIWDKGDGTTRVSVTSSTRSTKLQEQDITQYSSGFISSTQTPFDFATASNPSGKMGWFMDLTLLGTTAGSSTDPLHSERVIASPTVILGTLLVNTFQAVGDICVPGGLNSLIELDALTGSANFSEIVPTGGSAPPGSPSGSATGGTNIGTGSPLGSPLPVVNVTPPPVIGNIDCVPGSPGCAPITGGGGSNDCKWTLPNPANKAIQTPIPCGRVSWRQLR